MEQLVLTKNYEERLHVGRWIVNTDLEVDTSDYNALHVLLMQCNKTELRALNSFFDEVSRTHKILRVRKNIEDEEFDERTKMVYRLSIVLALIAGALYD